MVRRKAAVAEPAPKKVTKAPAREGGGMNSDDRGDAAPMDVDEDEEDLQAAVRNDIDEEDLLSMEIPPMPEIISGGSDGSGQRLMIASIEVENFKSYYGKRVLGPFHQNFTAIIGPNGSGKSNVIDSLLFVFGFRASKIRTKKISVLIHSSAGHEDLTSCTVAVNFQKIIDLPDGSFDVVPGSQFKVSRTAYKDNSSKYTYNGKTVQFKDIARILRDVGIDLIHNRFLILQGEVEQIAMMKPMAQNDNDDGMLEYLEDIIGSSRLKLPITKLEDKIEKLQDERHSQLEKVKYAEQTKNEAEGPVKEMINLLRIGNGIALAQNKIFAVQRVDLDAAVKSDEEKLAKVEGELKEGEARMKELAALMKNKKHELSHLQSKYDRAQQAHEKAKRALDDANQWEGKRKAEKLRLNEKKKKLTDDIVKEQKKIDDLEKVPDKANAKIAEHQKVLAEIEEIIPEKKAKVDERLAQFEQETVDLQAVKRNEEEKVGQLAIDEDNASSKLTLAQEELQLLRNEEEKERKKLSDLKSALENATASLETKKSDLGKARKGLPNVEEELRTKKAELTNIKNEESQRVDKVRSLRTKFEKRRQSVEAFRSQNNVQARLMREKNSGAIPGLYGRLGDLGAIDAKYDVAISSTCGQLDNYVVDTIDTAVQCVEFLKRENLGRSTFIALDKQENLKKYMQKPERTPENVPRLFDLIKVADPKVLPAFYYALRETLVADDMQMAKRIAMDGSQRRRVVTLKGQVIEASGTMTGGGTSVRRGRIGQSVKIDTSKDTGAEVANLQKELESEQELLNQAANKAHQLEGRVNVLQADFDKLRRNERNLESEIGPLEEKIATLEKCHAEQKERAKGAIADEGAVQRAKQKVAQLQKVRDEASEKADAVRERVADATAKIQEVYDRLVLPFRKELDEAQSKKDTASKGIAKEQSALNNAQRNVNKAKARKNDLEADLKDTDAEFEQLDNDAERHSEEVNELTTKRDEAQAAMKEAEASLKEASGKTGELDMEDTEVKKKVAALNRALEEQEKAVRHSRAAVDAIDAKVEKLHLDFVKCLDRLPEALRAHDNEEFSLKEALLWEKNFVEKLQANEMDALGEDDDEPVIRSNEFPRYTPEEVAAFDVRDIQFTISSLEKRKVAKNPNISGLKEYVTKLKRYEKEMALLTLISEKRDKHRQLCQKLKKQRMVEFMDGFTKIGVAVKEIYQMITLGGDASLDLVDSLDPFSEGVSFGVRPPKKSWKQITNLSGGEKTLASLALVFALHHYRPTPLYVMDEIDAALDFKNVSIIAHYVKDRTKNAQFIIISLRNNMFELGDRLIGIYKTYDCTKNVVIDPAKAYKRVMKIRNVLRELHACLTPAELALVDKMKAGDKEALATLLAKADEIKKRRLRERPGGTSLLAGTASKVQAALERKLSSKNTTAEIAQQKGPRRELSAEERERLATLGKHIEREKRLRDPVASLSIPLTGEPSTSKSPEKISEARGSPGNADEGPSRSKEASVEKSASPRAGTSRPAMKRTKKMPKGASKSPDDESNAREEVATDSSEDVPFEVASKKERREEAIASPSE